VSGVVFSYSSLSSQMLSERLQMSLSDTLGVIATELCTAQSKGFIRTPHWTFHWAAPGYTYRIRKKINYYSAYMSN